MKPVLRLIVFFTLFTTGLLTIWAAPPPLIWVAQSSGTTVTFKGIAFDGPTSTQGVAVGSNSFIWRTTDGKTWGVITGTPLATYNDVASPGSNTFIGATAAGGSVTRSIDGGLTWTSIPTGVTSAFYGIDFANTLQGWIVGASAVIRKTENGGSTWEPQAVPAGVTATLRDVDFLDALNGWIVGDSGTILKTTNGGVSWVAKPSGSSAILYAVHFRTALEGFAVGASRTILRTVDGGETWTPITVSSIAATATLEDVNFVPGSTSGTIVGYDGTTGIILMTTSGTAWGSQAPTGTSQLRALGYTSNLRYAVGSSGTILVYDTALPSVPTGLTWTTPGNDTTPTFTWTASTDNLSVTAYEYRIDTGAWVNVGNILTVTLGSALTDGTYTFSLRAKDAAGNTSSPYTQSVFTIDTVSPAAPGTLTRTSVGTDTTPSFSWSAAIDNVGVTAYEVQMDDDAYLDIGNTLTYEYPIPLAVGTHTFEIKARDAAGNRSTSPALSFTISLPEDSTPPSVPSGLTRTTLDTDTTPTFTWSAATDNVAVTSYEVRLYRTSDQVRVVDDLSIGNVLTYTLPSTLALPTGIPYGFMVKALDAAQNNGPWSAPVLFAVSAAPPAPDTTAPTGTIVISASAAFTRVLPNILTLTCTDNVACTQMQLGLDGTADTEAWEAFNSSPTITLPAGEGVKTIAVRFRDGAGNTSTQVSDTIILDTAPSNIGSITPVTAVAGTVQTFSASYTDTQGVSGCDFIVDGTLQGVMTLGVATTGTATRAHTFSSPGAHTVQIRCTDLAGNTGLGTLTTVTVSGPPETDTTAPSAPAGLTRVTADTDTTPTFTWIAATDNVGVVAYEVQINNGFFENIGSASAYTSAELSAGTHILRVRARDAADNTSATVSLTFTITITAAQPTSGSGTTFPTGSGTAPAPGTASTGIPSRPPFTLDQMNDDAQVIVQGTTGPLLARLGYDTLIQCQMDQATASDKVDRLFGMLGNELVHSAIINFTACGTPTTLHLGAGERLGVVNSYKAAYGRLPSTVAHWFDIIKIANGRFPGEISTQAEAGAKTRFRQIYLRDAVMSQPNDSAAVTVMAYGLRPLPRNVAAEAAAISIYKKIFGRMPFSAIDWDALRAIAYSGARR